MKLHSCLKILSHFFLVYFYTYMYNYLHYYQKETRATEKIWKQCRILTVNSGGVWVFPYGYKMLPAKRVHSFVHHTLLWNNTVTELYYGISTDTMRYRNPYLFRNKSTVARYTSIYEIREIRSNPLLYLIRDSWLILNSQNTFLHFDPLLPIFWNLCYNIVFK